MPACKQVTSAIKERQVSSHLIVFHQTVLGHLRQGEISTFQTIPDIKIKSPDPTSDKLRLSSSLGAKY
jgi:hypothetical protein